MLHAMSYYDIPSFYSFIYFISFAFVTSKIHLDPTDLLHCCYIVMSWFLDTSDMLFSFFVLQEENVCVESDWIPTCVKMLTYRTYVSGTIHMLLKFSTVTLVIDARVMLYISTSPVITNL